jgi:hypothetical protein
MDGCLLVVYEELGYLRMEIDYMPPNLAYICFAKKCVPNARFFSYKNLPI